MKERLDLVRAWIRKAENDLTALRLALGAGQALDTACFHAQQAAEKYLKAYLVFSDLDLPPTHSLVRLAEKCAQQDPAFLGLRSLMETLTPYAVELRYDADFEPTLEVAEEAREIALKIRAFIATRLPHDLLADFPPSAD